MAKSNVHLGITSNYFRVSTIFQFLELNHINLVVSAYPF